MQQTTNGNTARSFKQSTPPVRVRVGDREWWLGDAGAVPTNAQSGADRASNRERIGGPSESGEPFTAAQREEMGSRSRWTRWIWRARQRLAVSSHHGRRGAVGRFAPLRRLLASSTVLQDTIKTAFQFGLTVGLALGCATLWLFHQLEPDYVLPQPNGGTRLVASVGNQHGVQLPGLKLLVLAVGPYSTEDSALRAAKQVTAYGLPAVVHRTTTGHYVLWIRAAIQSKHLQTTAASLQKHGLPVRVDTLLFKAHQVPALNGASQAALETVDRWIASAVSSIMAFTAVLADHGVAADATTIYRRAEQLTPSADNFGETGYAAQLGRLQRDLAASFASAQHQRDQQAMAALLDAVEELSVLYGAT